MAAAAVAAAGGVLWRRTDDRVELALVHRPRYDDWSLPKGKLAPGEHVLLGAVREVAEETGHHAVVGRPLSTQRYQVTGEDGPVPKSVRYWSMRALDGHFEAGAEVDELAWLSADAAVGRVTREADRATVAEFLGGPVHTVPMALVRHGSAGSRRRWDGDDRDRPLDRTGAAQAQALRPLLGCYRPTRVLSADFRRCVDTVAPYAAEQGLDIEREPAFSEPSFAADREATLARCLQVIADAQATVICSQGKVLPDLVDNLCRHFGAPVPSSTAVPKGAFWVLHLAADRLVALERHAPKPADT